MEPPKRSKKVSTEERLMETIREVQIASLGKQMFYKSMGFTGAPGGQYAVVAAFAVCTDTLAKQLRRNLDSAMDEFVAENGLSMTSNPPHRA